MRVFVDAFPVFFQESEVDEANSQIQNKIEQSQQQQARVERIKKSQADLEAKRAALRPEAELRALGVWLPVVLG